MANACPARRALEGRFVLLSQDHAAAPDGAPRSAELIIRRASGAPEGAVVYEISGDVDLSNSARLAAEAFAPWAASGAPLCVLDLSGLLFIDSSGVTEVVAAYKDARKRGARLALACVNGQPSRVLMHAGLTQVLPDFPSVEAALALRDGENDSIGEGVPLLRASSPPIT